MRKLTGYVIGMTLLFCFVAWSSVFAGMQVAAGASHTVGLKTDGTVVAVGLNYYGQLNVSGWSGIVQVAAGALHTVGLKSDGTVVAIGLNEIGQLNVSNWKGIVQVAAGHGHTVGLKADGTVVAVGLNDYGQCNVGGWTDIVQVTAGYYHTVGVKADGTVVAVGSNFGQLNVSNWTDIVQVAAGSSHTVGLMSDGTVVAVGENYYGQCSVGNWIGFVQVAAGDYHTVGLRSDGTVVAVGYNDFGQLNVSNWTDIVQVAAGWGHTVGVKADGTVVAVGRNNFGQSSVGYFNLLPDMYSISGAVTGDVQASVTLTLSGPASKSTTTNSSGHYSFSELLNGTYTVTPSLSGYTFEPLSSEVTISVEDVTGINFLAFATKPDLIETSVSDPPSIALVGSSFSVTDTVKNKGNATSGASTTRYYLSLDTRKDIGDILLMGSRFVPGLVPGETSTGTKNVKIPSGTAANTYYLLACSDDTKVVAESNENNNCKASSIKVQVTP